MKKSKKENGNRMRLVIVMFGILIVAAVLIYQGTRNSPGMEELVRDLSAVTADGSQVGIWKSDHLSGQEDKAPSHLTMNE